jgi:protein-disulfide isomerase
MNQAKLVIGILVGTVAVLTGVGWLMTRLGEGDKRVVDVAGDARLATGSAEARVTIVEWSDFQCPACKQAEPALKQILADYPQEVRLVYRHFPLTQIHQQALAAAILAEAANAEGKFWQMHDLLFERQSEWENNGAKFNEYRRELGISEAGDYRELVQRDVRDGQVLRINATPTFFVNGRKTNVVKLRAVIEEELRLP